MRISDWSSDVCSSDLYVGAPKHQLTMGARFVLPLDESIGEVVLSGDYYLQSSICLDDSALQSANSFGKQKGYCELNLRSDWNGSGGSPIDLSVFSRHVLKNTHHVSYG